MKRRRSRPAGRRIERRVQYADLDPAGQQYIDTGHADVAAHGLEVHVQPAGDRLHRQALFAQFIDLLVALPGVRDPHRVRPLQHGQVRRFLRQVEKDFAGGVTGRAATGLLAVLLDGLGYQQVDVLGFSWGGALAQQFAVQ